MLLNCVVNKATEKNLDLDSEVLYLMPDYIAYCVTLTNELSLTDNYLPYTIIFLNKVTEKITHKSMFGADQMAQ